MPLPGICPACGAEAPIEAFLTDAEAREALGALLGLLPEREARLIPRYAALFAPRAKRVQWPKLTRVLRELTARIQAAQVERRGQVRACPRGLWLDAIEAVLANYAAGTVRVPLADHAYLDSIAWDKAEPRPGTYTAPAPAPAAAAPADPRREAALTAHGLRRMIARLEALAAPVPEAVRTQLAAAERTAGIAPGIAPDPDIEDAA